MTTTKTHEAAFALGQRVRVNPLGISGHVDAFHVARNRGPMYLIEYVDRNGQVHTHWAFETDLVAEH